MADVIWLDVLPSLGGFVKELTGGTTQAAKAAGASAGGTWSKEFSGAAGDSGSKTVVAELEKASKGAQRAVQDATKNIAQARAGQSEAAARLVLAEQALADSIDKTGQDSAKSQAAALRLEAARERSGEATRKVTANEEALRAAHRESRTAAEQLEEAQKGVSSEGDKQVGVWDRLKGAMAGGAAEAGATESKLGGLVTKLAAAAGGAALFAAGWTGAMDLSTGTAKVTAALGLTETQSATAGQVAGALYADSYGESMGDVQVGVEAVMSSLDGMRDASEADLQAVTGQAMSLAGAFDLDVQEAVTAAGGLIKNGLAPDATGAFDLITASLQQVPAAMRGDVLDAANEYGGVFSSLGLSGSQSLGMLASASDGGVIAIDKVGDSLKEFTIRATDMSTGSVAAYDALGLNAEQMSNRLLAGGESASGAMSEIVGELMAIKDPAEQANTAIALFGTPLEDLGVSKIPDFLSSLSAMDSGLGDVTGKAGELDEAMAGTVDPIESLKRTFGGALTDALTPFAGWVSEVMPGVQDLFSIIFKGDYTGGLFESFGIAEDSAIVDFLFDVRDGVTGITGILFSGDYSGGLKNIGLEEDSALVDFFFDVRDGVMAFGSYLTDTAIPALQDFGGWIVDNKDYLLAFGISVGVVAAGLGIMNVVSGVAAAGGLKSLIMSTNAAKTAQAAFNLVMNANPIGLLVTAIVALVGGLVYFFTQTETGKAAWESFTTAIGTAWDWVSTKLGEGWNWIRDNVFTPVSDGVGWVATKFGEARDSAVGAWNTMRDGIKSGWDFVLTWVINPYLLGVQWVWDKFVAAKDGIVGAWNLTRDGLSAGWTWVSTNVFEPIKTGVAAVGTGFETAKSVMTGAWDTVKTSVSATWDSIRDNVFDKVTSGVAAVGTAFEGARDVASAAFSKLANLARTPINFILGTVYNDGIRAGFNTIASAVGLDLRLPTASLAPEFSAASGGVLPGYTPGRDVHHFSSPTGGNLHLSGGEAFMVPEFTRAVGGATGVARLNARARAGAIDDHSFFAGGVVDWLGNAASNVGQFVSDTASTVKDMVVNVAGFLADPAGGFKSLLTTPMESLLGDVMSSDLGKMMVEIPRKAVSGIIDKALGLIGQSSSVSGGFASGLPDMMATGGWSRPSRGRITSAYGPRWGAFHNGTDFAGGGATYAAGAGRVSKLGWGVGYGNTGINLMIDHGNGLETLYGHNPSMAAVKVRPGDYVRAGQHVGQEGATGNVTGVHLHWSAFRNGKSFNPMSLLGSGGGGRAAQVYDNGGRLLPGQVGVNLSTKPEVVFTDEQWQSIHTLAGLENDSGLREVNLNVRADSQPLAEEIVRKGVAALATLIRSE